MKRCSLVFFMIIVLSTVAFAKEEGVMILRGDRNVNALKGLEAINVSLKIETAVEEIKINVDEVKAVLQNEIVRCLGDRETLTLFQESAPVLNVFIDLKSIHSNSGKIYSSSLTANLKNSEKEWTFEYKCKTDKKEEIFKLSLEHQDRFLKAYQDAKDNKLDPGDSFRRYIVNRSLTTLAFYLKKDYKSVN